MILSISLSGFPPASAPADARPPAQPIETPDEAQDDEPEWSLTETIRNAVRNAFEADLHVHSERIAIAVTTRMIALFGTVPDERVKRAAFELASAIPGAPPVRNLLRVG